MKWAAAFLWAMAAASASAAARPEADRAAEAKTLFFDRKYAEARKAWTAVRDARTNDAAPYWIARCSELLGEDARALDEYGRYLAARPSDDVLAEEARTSRIGLALRLYRSGHREHLRVIVDSLDDPSRTVRYFAALQLASLGPPAGRPAVPVLRRIVEDERDADLVDRAKLALMRLDPQSLPPEPGRRRGGVSVSGRWIHVQIYDKGKPKVDIRFPLALAELVFKNLPEDTRRELKGRGYDADNFLEQLQELGPARLVDIQGEDGEKVEIWIE